MTSPDLVRLSSGDVEVVVDLSRGARAVSWTFAGHELLARHGDDPVEYGMYPMAPWAGRVRGNVVDGPDGPVALPLSYAEWALHGTVLGARMTVEEVDTDRGVVRASVPTPPWWPWPSTVAVAWEVTDHEVTTAITVSSTAEGCPVVVGWHPWFRRRLASGGPVAWTMAVAAQAERGPDHLPTGALVAFDAAAGPFDDAFVVPDRRVVLDWPGAVRLEVESTYEWFVVYDELDDAVCVEPQSGPPDGLRPDSVRPAQTAGPGSPVRLGTRWRLSASGG